MNEECNIEEFVEFLKGMLYETALNEYIAGNKEQSKALSYCADERLDIWLGLYMSNK